MRMKKLILILIAAFTFVSVARSASDHFFENDGVSLAVAATPGPPPLMVPLTLIQGAASKGAGLSLSLSLSEIISLAFLICFILFYSYGLCIVMISMLPSP